MRNSAIGIKNANSASTSENLSHPKSEPSKVHMYYEKATFSKFCPTEV